MTLSVHAVLVNVEYVSDVTPVQQDVGMCLLPAELDVIHADESKSLVVPVTAFTPQQDILVDRKQQILCNSFYELISFGTCIDNTIGLRNFDIFYFTKVLTTKLLTFALFGITLKLTYKDSMKLFDQNYYIYTGIL